MKTALVTGGTGAIGSAIVKALVLQDDFEVTFVARNQQRAESTLKTIQQKTGKYVSYLLADISNKQDVIQIAEGWPGSLDILINNAAITPRRRHETAAGIEMQFATNVMGYFWMTSLLSPRLVESGQGRVINVASYWAGGLDFDDVQFRKRPYDNDSAYRQSKQADRMLSVAFAERFSEKGISVVACHPGDVNSTLSNNLGFGGHESPDQGADTPVWLALNDAGKKSGCYFEHRKEQACAFGSDKNAVHRLYEICKAL